MQRDARYARYPYEPRYGYYEYSEPYDGFLHTYYGVMRHPHRPCSISFFGSQSLSTESCEDQIPMDFDHALLGGSIAAKHTLKFILEIATMSDPTTLKTHEPAPKFIVVIATMTSVHELAAIGEDVVATALGGLAAAEHALKSILETATMSGPTSLSAYEPAPVVEDGPTSTRKPATIVKYIPASAYEPASIIEATSAKPKHAVEDEVLL